MVQEFHDEHGPTVFQDINDLQLIHCGCVGVGDPFFPLRFSVTCNTDINLSVQMQKLAEQEIILVRCIPPACKPYMFRCCH